MSKQPFTLTAETVYSYGPDGSSACMVASDLRKMARNDREWAVVPPTGQANLWVNDAIRESLLDNANRREQAAAVIDKLMPLGRRAVEVGCSLIGADITPAELVEAVTAALTPRGLAAR